MLFIRGVGPVGYPGSAEVVNMQPPDALMEQGIAHLPTVGDGRQSGTSESPSILNASPESAIGGGLACCRPATRCVSISTTGGSTRWCRQPSGQAAARRGSRPYPASQTPWQEFFRTDVGQLAHGGCLEFATHYQRVARTLPRDNH